MFKHCINCNLIKSLDEFQTRIRNNKIVHLGRCRICETERIREWKQKEAKEKKEQKLIDLGITEKIEEGYKHCTKCLKVKKNEEFGKYKKQDKQYINSACFECLKISARKLRIKKCVLPQLTRKCRYCKMVFNKNFVNSKYVCQDCAEKNQKLPDGLRRCCYCENITKTENFGNRTLPSGNKGKKSYCNTCNKLIHNPKRRILNALQKQNITKSVNSIDLIGCSYSKLKQWFEYQFDTNMSWENMGTYWHIDHVTPCSLFDFNKIEEQYKCFNWKNMRPLKAITNIKKSDKKLDWEILFQELKVKYYEKVKT